MYRFKDIPIATGLFSDGEQLPDPNTLYELDNKIFRGHRRVSTFKPSQLQPFRKASDWKTFDVVQWEVSKFGSLEYYQSGSVQENTHVVSVDCFDSSYPEISVKDSLNMLLDIAFKGPQAMEDINVVHSIIRDRGEIWTTAESFDILLLRAFKVILRECFFKRPDRSNMEVWIPNRVCRKGIEIGWSPKYSVLGQWSEGLMLKRQNHIFYTAEKTSEGLINTQPGLGVVTKEEIKKQIDLLSVQHLTKDISKIVICLAFGNTSSYKDDPEVEYLMSCYLNVPVGDVTEEVKKTLKL